MPSLLRITTIPPLRTILNNTFISYLPWLDKITIEIQAPRDLDLELRLTKVREHRVNSLSPWIIDYPVNAL